ncbi:hypothetical protein B0H14DRAFT_3535902 [Mycena olivaceomarginata]|nr:hypothetical protein B0H14DRAFT_3535902 [Mycena olivaceomarginata]
MHTPASAPRAATPPALTLECARLGQPFPAPWFACYHPVPSSLLVLTHALGHRTHQSPFAGLYLLPLLLASPRHSLCHVSTPLDKYLCLRLLLCAPRKDTHQKYSLSQHGVHHPLTSRLHLHNKKTARSLR